MGLSQRGVKTHPGTTPWGTGSRRPSTRQGGRPREDPALRPLGPQPPAPDCGGHRSVASGPELRWPRADPTAPRGRRLSPRLSERQNIIRRNVLVPVSVPCPLPLPAERRVLDFRTFALAPRKPGRFSVSAVNLKADSD